MWATFEDDRLKGFTNSSYFRAQHAFFSLSLGRFSTGFEHSDQLPSRGLVSRYFTARLLIFRAYSAFLATSCDLGYFLYLSIARRWR